MKKIIYLCFILFFNLACNRPSKLLEKGKDNKALRSSLNRLKKGKVHEKHVLVFEESFNNITSTDAHRILDLKNQGQPKLWLEIRKIAENIIYRQTKVEKIAQRIATKGYFPDLEFYPAKELFEEATDNVALYYYAQALEYIPLARNGEKRAARKAYTQILNCRKYRAEFRDAPDLEVEMLQLGTTHILIKTIASNLSTRLEDQLMHSFFYNHNFPIEFPWKRIYSYPPNEVPMDYEAEIYFGNLNESGHQTSECTCSNTETVQVGCETQKVWSESDSAYIEIQVPVYDDVSVTVTTIEQSMEASLYLWCNLIPIRNPAKESTFSIYERSCWSNEYSEVYGDSRALNFMCDDEGGSYESPPDPLELWLSAAYGTRKSLVKKLKKSVY